MLISLIQARIRIPIPAELAGPLTVISGIILLLFAIWAFAMWVRNRQTGGGPAASAPRIETQVLIRTCLAALAALVLADVAFAVLTGARLDGREILVSLVPKTVLVFASALLWRLDLLGAALSALVYGLIAPPLAPLMLFGRPMFFARPAVTSFLWAICLLGGLSLVVPRLKPKALGVFVGAAAGCLLGRLFYLGTGGGLGVTPLMWAVAYALIVGGLLALAASVVKPSAVR